MNKYGRGPRIINRRRSYRVLAECRVEAEEAEDLFNDLSAAVEDRFPGIVLEITDVYEDD